jgi:hypothetical protein
MRVAAADCSRLRHLGDGGADLRTTPPWTRGSHRTQRRSPAALSVSVRTTDATVEVSCECCKSSWCSERTGVQIRTVFVPMRQASVNSDELTGWRDVAQKRGSLYTLRLLSVAHCLSSRPAEHVRKPEGTPYHNRCPGRVKSAIQSACLPHVVHSTSSCR